MAEFNLAVALLAQGDAAGAQAAYRRGVALARRQPSADGRQLLEDAIGDLALLPPLPDAARADVERLRAWLEGELARLATSGVTPP